MKQIRNKERNINMKQRIKYTFERKNEALI